MTVIIRIVLPESPPPPPHRVRWGGLSRAKKKIFWKKNYDKKKVTNYRRNNDEPSSPFLCRIISRRRKWQRHVMSEGEGEVIFNYFPPETFVLPQKSLNYRAVITVKAKTIFIFEKKTKRLIEVDDIWKRDAIFSWICGRVIRPMVTTSKAKLWSWKRAIDRYKMSGDSAKNKVGILIAVTWWHWLLTNQGHFKFFGGSMLRPIITDSKAKL